MASGKKGKFKIQLKESETVNLTETLRLECEVNKPDISVIWLKDELIIEENNTVNRIMIEKEGCKRTLVIQDVCEDDAGVYECVSKEKTKCTVEVKEMPLQFSKPLKGTKVKEVEKLMLQCQLNKPNIPVKWLKDGQEIVTDKRIKLIQEKCDHSLLIAKTSAKDSGTYKCVYEKTESECVVQVTEMPLQFSKHLKDTKVKEVEKLMLQCQLNKPNIPVQWLKDGQEIVTDKRIKLIQEKCDHSLLIEKTSAEDSGTYKCVYEETESQCAVQVTVSDGRTPRGSISDGRTHRSSISDGRTSNTFSPIAQALCVVLVACFTIYFVNRLNNMKSPHIFEKEILEQRFGDIDKAIRAMQIHQKADERSLTEMVEKYTKERQQKQETELQSLKSKLQGVENDVTSKADKTKLEDLGSQFNNKVTEIEEKIRTRTEKMEQVLNEKLKELKNSFNELENDFNDTKVSLRLLKQETDERVSLIRTTLSDINKFLDHDFKNSLNEVFEQMNAIKEAKKEADEILEHIKGDLRKIKPNTFNKEALTAAFLTLTVIVFCLAFWIYRVQARLATGGPLPNRSMNAADVLQQIPARVTLGNSVCIISFDEARQAAHEALVSSAFLTVQNVPVENFVVRRHEHLLRLPKCKFYIMCTEFSERHVIIEEPGLGLGDLKRCTYETIQRYGAQMVILYTRDPGSRNLGGNLYNPRIHCVSSQPELSRLRELSRFLSTYDELTENQKQSLNGTIAQCLQ